jgi:hypothetical protein
VYIGSTLIWSYSAFDPDAQLFITNAGITDTTQQSAINTLVVSLKGNNIWTKMKAIYPFVGGTASQHKFNLKTPIDSDSAYRLVFNGGWVHSSTGALPNGVNSWANTFLAPSLNLTNNNYHISHYSRTQQTNTNAVDVGVLQEPIMIAIDQYYSAVSAKAFVAGDYISNVILQNNTNTKGLLVGSRTSNVNAKMFFNGTQNGATLTVNNTNALPSFNFYISALNHVTAGGALDFSAKETAFTSIGDGLTDIEAANYYTAVQTFQTSLSRQVI